MSDSPTAGFGKFVPGFDFLQNLVKGATQSIPQMPNLSNWVAPSLNVEELEKRIGELKAVHFWLEQNSRALGATIQALEVQKMTLAALKGMNFNLGDVTDAFKLKAADTVASPVQPMPQRATSAAESVPRAPAEPLAGDTARNSEDAKQPAKSNANAFSGLVDPLQLWGSLTQQFQQIAASALKDVSASAAGTATRDMAAASAEQASRAGGKPASAAGAAQATTKKSARKAAPRKT